MTTFDVGEAAARGVHDYLRGDALPWLNSWTVRGAHAAQAPCNGVCRSRQRRFIGSKAYIVWRKRKASVSISSRLAVFAMKIAISSRKHRLIRAPCSTTNGSFKSLRKRGHINTCLAAHPAQPGSARHAAFRRHHRRPMGGDFHRRCHSGRRPLCAQPMLQRAVCDSRELSTASYASACLGTFDPRHDRC
jgi:hypothetical protein